MSTRLVVVLDRVSAWCGALGAGGGTVLKAFWSNLPHRRDVNNPKTGSCGASLSDP